MRSWCYLGRHLRADPADDPAALLRLANFAPDRLAPLGPTSAWWGVFAPPGPPKAIVSRFADELAPSLRDPRVAKQLNETQQVTFALGGPEELRKFVSEQMRLWGPVAREHNIQAD